MKIDKKMTEVFDKYWKEYEVIETEFLNKVKELEDKLQKELNNRGIGFTSDAFAGLSLFTGVGTINNRNIFKDEEDDL